MYTNGNVGLRKKIYIYYVSLETRGKFETNVYRIFLLFALFRATGVLNVEISEKCALDLKQREIIILMTHYHSGVLLCDDVCVGKPK